MERTTPEWNDRENRTRPIPIFLICYLSAILIATVCTAQGTPNTPVLSFDGEIREEQIAGHLDALRDPDHQYTVEDVLTRNDWQRLSGGGADFGYTRDVIWLRLPLLNTSSDTVDWRLHVRENFFQEFAVWLVGPDDTPIALEFLDEGSAFAERNVQYAELVTAVPLPPEEMHTLILRYRSGGSSEITFSILPADAFGTLAASRTARNFIFYGMMVLLITAGFAAFLVTGFPVFGAYGLYAGFGLLFIMHADGNTFQYLWPHAPFFNAYSSILLGAGLILSGANFARQFLQTATYHPRLDKLLIGAMIVPFLFIAASLVIDHQYIKKYLVLVSTMAVLLFAAAGAIAARTRFREVKFYVIAWFGALLSSLLMTMRHWFGLEISDEAQFNSMRVVFVVDAVLMGFAIIDRINVIKRRSQLALAASLEEARRNLDLSERLRDLEQQYRLAENLATSQRRKMADTVHDLRGPLHGLRLNVKALMRGDKAGSDAEIDETFRYLENLVTQELATHTRTESAPTLAEEHAESKPEKTTALKVILDAIAPMFEAEARDKGLDLRIVPTSATTAIPALDVMRIITNLVSNAIRYADKGRVLVGLRRGPDGLRLEVHDEGAGLDAAGFAAATARAVRLDPDGAPEGAGLGLAILSDLATQHSLEFGLVPGRQSGTGVFVTLPEARRADFSQMG